MDANTAKNLDRLQDMIEQTLLDLIAKETDNRRTELLEDALEFTHIARFALEVGDMDKAGRALERAKARIQEVAA